MRNFYRLLDGLDTGPVLHALQAQPNLWNGIKTRTSDYVTAHSEVEDIVLRFASGADEGVPELDRLRHELIMAEMPAWKCLPQVRPLIFGLMRQVEGECLGRVFISRLAPGKKILPHTDKVGAYSDFYRRYHIVLQGHPGSVFHCADETVQMLTGEIWTFNHMFDHSVVNNSATDRIHLIADIKPCP